MGEEFTSIIADELNVREVVVMPVDKAEEAGFKLEQKLTVNARAAGPRLGKNVQAAIKGSKSGDWSVTDGVVTAGGIELQEGEYTLEDVAESGQDGIVLAPTESGFVALDTVVTDELRAEGQARDTIRAIQSARKELDLHVSDRIDVTVSVPAESAEALSAYSDLIAKETLAETLRITQEPLGEGQVFEAAELADGAAVRVEKHA